MRASIIYNALTAVAPLQLEMNSNAIKILTKVAKVLKYISELLRKNINMLSLKSVNINVIHLHANFSW